MDRDDAIRMLTALVAQARISGPDGNKWFQTPERMHDDARHCVKVAIALHDVIEEEIAK